MTVRTTQFKAGFHYAKAVAFLVDLQKAGQDQGERDRISTAEEPVEAPAPRRVPKQTVAMGVPNHRFGCNSVRLGSTAMATNCAETAVWAKKRERRSPRYTIMWNEMPTIGT